MKLIQNAAPLRVVRSLNKILALSLFFLLLLVILAQVAMRNLFSVPLIGAEELARYLFIAIVFLSLPMAFGGKGHIRMAELQVFLPRKLKFVIRWAISLTLAAVFGVFAVAAVVTTMKNLDNKTPTLGIPFALFFLPTILGFALSALEATLHLCTGVGKDPDDPHDAGSHGLMDPMPGDSTQKEDQWGF